VTNIANGGEVGDGEAAGCRETHDLSSEHLEREAALTIRRSSMYQKFNGSRCTGDDVSRVFSSPADVATVVCLF
jgi:hypothetical protein